MAHEERVLTNIAEARAAIVKANGPKEAAEANQRLTEGLSTLFVMVSEQYPDLKANANFAQLQEELVSTENRVSLRRQAYNDAVMLYHNGIEGFPGNIIAGGRFKPMELFELPLNSAARDVPTIKF